jgi:hypothetical protein
MANNETCTQRSQRQAKRQARSEHLLSMEVRYRVRRTDWYTTSNTRMYTTVVRRRSWNERGRMKDRVAACASSPGIH